MVVAQKKVVRTAIRGGSCRLAVDECEDAPSHASLRNALIIVLLNTIYSASRIDHASPNGFPGLQGPDV